MAKTKVCTKCGIEKNLDEFYPLSKNDKTRLRAMCKHCFRIQGQEYSKKNEKKRIKLASKIDFNKLTKICSKCGAKKPYSEFYINNSKKDGIDTDCKECALERSRIYYQRNRDKRLQYSKDYYETNKSRR